MVLAPVLVTVDPPSTPNCPARPNGMVGLDVWALAMPAEVSARQMVNAACAASPVERDMVLLRFRE